MASIGHIKLLWLIITCFLAIAADATKNKGSEFTVEGGWSEVSRGWPTKDKDYFIATEKGHHYVEASLLKNLKQDLLVSFEYYYSYSKTRPVLQMTPCRENIYLDDQGSNRWIKHTYHVKHSDCNARNELAYNALLHDPGDVFAWKKMEIEYVPEEPSKPTVPLIEDEILDDNKEDDIVRNEVIKEDAANGPDLNEKSDKKETISVDHSLETKKLDEAPNDLDKSPSKNKKDSPPKPDVVSPRDPSDSNNKNEHEQREDAAKGLKPAKIDMNPDKKPTVDEQKLKDKVSEDESSVDEPANDLLNAAEDDSDVIDNRQLLRHKRDVTIKSSTLPLKYVCQPSSCNKSTFKMSSFSGLIHGLPEIENNKKATRNKYFVNLKNQPLKIKFKSYDEPLTEVDSCVAFSIYMEKDTEFEFLLEDSTDSKESKLLEVIKRKSSDSTASHWDQFYRCISDYMPRFSPGRKADNSFKFVVKPVASQRPAQMAIVIDQNEASSFRHLYPIQSYIPDLNQISDFNQLKKLWVLDRDGLYKHELELIQDGDRKKLHISKIDPAQDTFDITSRWMQIKDVEILEQPILFVYKAEYVDWIDRIDFEYQRAGDSSDHWKTQTAYLTPKVAVISQKKPENSDTGESSTMSSSPVNTDQRANLIDLPVKLKGADSSEFRIRVRHHIKRPVPPRASSLQLKDLSLNIKSLSFADACAYSRSYCKNNGRCKPTGPSQAECICTPGHSGRFCEHVRPCDVMYGSVVTNLISGSSQDNRMTGHKLCGLTGARCIDQLPVMRCEWDNDQYYQCKRLFKYDPKNDKYSLANDKNSLNGESGGNHAGRDNSESLDDLEPEEQVRRLKEENQQLSKTIIILTVFLIALMVFAVVLIGSMISRLRTSTGRLRKSQSEVHELSRRAHGMGQFSGTRQTPGSRGTGGGNSTIGYNNSAFDVGM